MTPHGLRYTSLPLVLAAIALGACTVPPILTPKTGPGTPWACTPQEHPCGNDACCEDGAVCGGSEPGCRDLGTCCWVGGGDDLGAPRVTAARRRPQ